MNTNQNDVAEIEHPAPSNPLKFREDERWRWQRRMILNLSTLPLMPFEEAVSEADEYILGRRH